MKAPQERARIGLFPQNCATKLEEAFWRKWSLRFLRFKLEYGLKLGWFYNGYLSKVLRADER